MSKCSADETPVCCCMDVGTIMDNSDCTASYSRVFANRAEAEQTLAALTEKARSVESEPCKITRLSLKSLTVCAWISISLLPAKLKC
ncbi:protein YfcZ [Escherichia coli]|uniref:Protein YfcZ n=1 Tax=Escherichia coli TaxID=562 RepID=A0A3S5DUB9_ECOLX|nr:protein YfcZ [Escherichia coli]